MAIFFLLQLTTAAVVVGLVYAVIFVGKRGRSFPKGKPCSYGLRLISTSC